MVAIYLGKVFILGYSRLLIHVCLSLYFLSLTVSGRR